MANVGKWKLPKQNARADKVIVEWERRGAG
jgi:hypothetical protein